MPKGVGIRSYA